MSRLMEKDSAFGNGADGNLSRESYKQEIKEDLKSLKDNAGGLAHELKEDGQKAAHDAADYLRDRLHALEDAGRDGLKKMEEHVQKKPGQSVAIAFAAGVLASILLGRR